MENFQRRQMQFRKTNFQFVHISVLHTLGLNSFFVPKFWDTEHWIHRDSKALKKWDTDTETREFLHTLRHWHSDTLKHWSFETLIVWSETLTIWDTNILRQLDSMKLSHCVDKTLSIWDTEQRLLDTYFKLFYFQKQRKFWRTKNLPRLLKEESVNEHLGHDFINESIDG